jgi:hypothetical protein
VGQLLHEGVLQSIRGMLPVKSILKEYLADDSEDTPASTTQTHEQEQEEQETEADIPPVVREETVDAAVAAAAVPVEEEVKEKEELVAPPPSPTSPHEEPKDLSGSVVTEAPVVTPQVPTIVVETEPPSVGFTHMDAVLDTENPEQTTIRLSNQMGDDDDDDDQVNSIEIDTSVPPEPLDEFEDLGDEPESLAVADDEFETL